MIRRIWIFEPSTAGRAVRRFSYQIDWGLKFNYIWKSFITYRQSGNKRATTETHLGRIRIFLPNTYTDVNIVFSQTRNKNLSIAFSAGVFSRKMKKTSTDIKQNLSKTPSETYNNATLWIESHLGMYSGCKQKQSAAWMVLQKAHPYETPFLSTSNLWRHFYINRSFFYVISQLIQLTNKFYRALKSTGLK